MDRRGVLPFGSPLAFAAALVVALGCGTPSPAPVTTTEDPATTPAPTRSDPPVLSSTVLMALDPPFHGDAKRGQSLVVRYECARCHDGTGQPAPFIDFQCKGCHERVLSGQLPFSKDRLDGWRATLRHYATTPDLTQAGRALRPSYLAAFLREPTKVRPHMEEWMPRLALSEKDASDIAAYLTASAPPSDDERPMGDAERGKSLAGSRGCFACHEFTGASRAEGAATIPNLSQKELGPTIVRAPDLRFVRDRFRPDALVQWIFDPSSVMKGALMPTLGLSEEDAKDLAAYLWTTKLEPLPSPPTPIARLPLLDRRVTYDEVSNQVFKKSCIHCHSDPDPKGGDAGPGSVGGLGFTARGVRLSSYAGLELGYIAKGGARESLLGEEPALRQWGGSRLVAALVARHEETSARPISEVRGMPLGLPALPVEDIQLVESWVAQGAPLH
jgi:cytochrome c2